MRKILLLLVVLIPLLSCSQSVGLFRYDTVKIYKQGGSAELVLLNKTRDTLGVLSNAGNGRTEFRRSRIVGDSLLLIGGDTLRIAGIGAGGSSAIPAGPISSLPTLGYNPGVNISVDSFINSVFYQSQPPGAGLSGGFTQEATGAGPNISYPLTWSGSRPASGAAIIDITITGAAQTYPQTFTPPAPGGSVNGSQSVSVPRNATTTFTNTVTAADGKVGTAFTTFQFQFKRYWGFVSSTSPAPGDILALSQELTITRAKGTFSVAAPGSPQNLAFCYPTSFGALTSLTIGGFESLPAFTRTTVFLTNASGGNTSYYYYISNNTFGGAVNNIITN